MSHDPALALAPALILVLVLVLAPDPDGPLMSRWILEISEAEGSVLAPSNHCNKDIHCRVLRT